MKDYLNSDYVDEQKIYIENIPAILLKPKGLSELIPTVIFYHGWTSDKESQRMRGLILASFGFQVLIADALHHGERKEEGANYEESTYFWETIFNSLDESELLIDTLIMKYKSDPKNIFVVGHSMGGFTSAGIFTQNPNINSMVAINGSCAWDDSNERMMKTLKIKMNKQLLSIQDKVKKLDPYNNLELIKNRPILMLNGKSDEVVPVESQRLFLKDIKPLYKNKDEINLIEYENLGHFLTAKMMEDTIIWLKKQIIN